jgi:hypothetical protein
MDAVCAYNKAATIGRSIGRGNIHTALGKGYIGHLFVQQYPVFMLDMVVQDLQELLPVKEMETVTMSNCLCYNGMCLSAKQKSTH